MSAMPGKVVVANAAQPMELDAILMKLEASGIEAVTEGEMTVAVDPLLSNAIGGIRVLVDLADEERAREVVQEHREAEKEAYESRAKTCPSCGSDAGMIIQRPIWFGFLLVLTLGLVALLYPWPKYSCPECGHKWR